MGNIVELHLRRKPVDTEYERAQGLEGYLLSLQATALREQKGMKKPQLSLESLHYLIEHCVYAVLYAGKLRPYSRGAHLLISRVGPMIEEQLPDTGQMVHNLMRRLEDGEVSKDVKELGRRLGINRTEEPECASIYAQLQEGQLPKDLTKWLFSSQSEYDDSLRKKAQKHEKKQQRQKPKKKHIKAPPMFPPVTRPQPAPSDIPPYSSLKTLYYRKDGDANSYPVDIVDGNFVIISKTLIHDRRGRRERIQQERKNIFINDVFNRSR